MKPDVIVGLESRGYYFASILAHELNLPFVAVRKAGKLPGDKVTIAYGLEYGPWRDSLVCTRPDVHSVSL
jgi:adenine phosphoribosyltransferase